MMNWNFSRINPSVQSLNGLICGLCLKRFKHDKGFCPICFKLYPPDFSTTDQATSFPVSDFAKSIIYYADPVEVNRLDNIAAMIEYWDKDSLDAGFDIPDPYFLQSPSIVASSSSSIDAATTINKAKRGRPSLGLSPITTKVSESTNELIAQSPESLSPSEKRQRSNLSPATIESTPKLSSFSSLVEPVAAPQPIFVQNSSSVSTLTITNNINSSQEDSSVCEEVLNSSKSRGHKVSISKEKKKKVVVEEKEPKTEVTIPTLEAHSIFDEPLKVEDSMVRKIHLSFPI